MAWRGVHRPAVAAGRWALTGGGRRVCVIGLLLPLPARAVPAFEVDQHVDPYRGCEIWLGKADSDGVAPVRAECAWADASPDRMLQALSRYTQWGAFVPEIKEEQVRQVAGGRTLLWQLVEPGHALSPREAQVWLWASPGGETYTWTTAKEPYTPRPGSVAMPRDEGSWTVGRLAGGGVTVVEQLYIDPGGYVPAWLVRWFQTEGLAHDMSYLHEYLTRPNP